MEKRADARGTGIAKDARMNLVRSFLSLLPFAVLLACGGSTTLPSGTDQQGQQRGDGQPGPAQSSSSSTNAPQPPTALPPTSVTSTSTVKFNPSFTDARRDSATAGCMEENVPFAPGDRYALQPVQTSGPYDKLMSIVISFKGTVNVKVPLDLVDGPGEPGSFNNAQHAHSTDLATGVIDLIVFPPNSQTDKPDPISPFDTARVTVINLPSAEGDPLTARVELHFVDGNILDDTFSAPVKSSAGACGGH